MADAKLSTLPVLATPATGDLLYVVDSGASKQITRENWFGAVPNTTITPQGQALKFAPKTGNAPWRLYTATAVAPNTDDQVFYLTNNCVYDPTMAWAVRDVDGLGAVRMGWESYWDAGDTEAAQMEWNLNIFPSGNGALGASFRVLHFSYYWATDEAEWRFWSKGAGSGFKVLPSTGTGMFQILPEVFTINIQAINGQTNRLISFLSTAGAWLNSGVDALGRFIQKSQAGGTGDAPSTGTMEYNATTKELLIYDGLTGWRKIATTL